MQNYASIEQGREGPLENIKTILQECFHNVTFVFDGCHVKSMDELDDLLAEHSTLAAILRSHRTVSMEGL